MKRYPLIVVFLFVLSQMIILSCNNESPTENDADQNILGITETNSLGEFIGEIDTTDWSIESYRNLSIKQNYWYSPKKKLEIHSLILGNVEDKIKIYNSGSESFNISIGDCDPFTVNPQSFDLGVDKLQEITVGINIQDEETVYQRDASFIVSNTDSFNIELKGSFGLGKGFKQGGILFYPAYPNPASDIINFEYMYSVQYEPITSIEIYRSTKQILKTIELSSGLSGQFRYTWDLKDDAGNLLEAGIYRAKLNFGDNSIGGDIAIVR